MKVRGIVWMGVQTGRFDEMATLLRALAGSSPSVDEPGFKLWSLPSGDLIELFAEGTKPTFGAAPVVGFLVDDLESSRREIETAGATIIGGYGPNDAGYESVHFRAPDGNVYELVHDPEHEARAGASNRDTAAGATI